MYHSFILVKRAIQQTTYKLTLSQPYLVFVVEMFGQLSVLEQKQLLKYFSPSLNVTID